MYWWILYYCLGNHQSEIVPWSSCGGELSIGHFLSMLLVNLSIGPHFFQTKCLGTYSSLKDLPDWASHLLYVGPHFPSPPLLSRLLPTGLVSVHWTCWLSPFSKPLIFLFGIFFPLLSAQLFPSLSSSPAHGDKETDMTIMCKLHPVLINTTHVHFIFSLRTWPCLGITYNLLSYYICKLPEDRELLLLLLGTISSPVRMVPGNLRMLNKY